MSTRHKEHYFVNVSKIALKLLVQMQNTTRSLLCYQAHLKLSVPLRQALVTQLFPILPSLKPVVFQMFGFPLFTSSSPFSEHQLSSKSTVPKTLPLRFLSYILSGNSHQLSSTRFLPPPNKGERTPHTRLTILAYMRFWNLRIWKVHCPNCSPVLHCPQLSPRRREEKATIELCSCICTRLYLYS